MPRVRPAIAILPGHVTVCRACRSMNNTQPATIATSASAMLAFSISAVGSANPNAAGDTNS